MLPGTSSTSFSSIQLFLDIKSKFAELFLSYLPIYNFSCILHLLLDVYRIFLGGGRYEHLALSLKRRSEWGVCFG